MMSHISLYQLLHFRGVKIKDMQMLVNNKGLIGGSVAEGTLIVGQMLEPSF